MRRINVLTISVCLFLTNSIFAQREMAKLKSRQVFAYSQNIADAAGSRIWMGFDAKQYFSLKADSGEPKHITFTSEPNNPNPQFFWQTSDEYFLSHTLEENLSHTFHEAFHGFERDPQRSGIKKWRSENSLLVFEYAETSARNNALFNIEGRILYSALQAEKLSALEQKTSEFLAVRNLRQSELDARFVEFEKGAESNEGLAEYAGTQAVVLGIQAANSGKISVPFVNSDSSSFLRKKYEKLNSITSAGRNIRLKFYYTGSALGFLLDKLMPNWKSRVQTNGISQQDLLTEATGGGKKSEKQLEVQAILHKYEYEKILQEEEIAVSQRKIANQALLDSTLNQKGLKVVIDFSALSQPGQIRNFDPMNVTMVAPRVRVHTRTVNFAGQYESFVAGFTQPVVEDLENSRYTTIAPDSTSVKITVDDVAIDANKPTEMQFTKNLVIASPNFNFRAGSGAITISDKDIVIRLTDKK